MSNQLNDKKNNETPSEVMDVDKSNEELSAEAKNEVAKQLFTNQEYKQALEAYNEAIKIFPNKAQYYCNRAACHLNLCQYKDALSDAKKSVELDPTFPKAYLRIIKSCILLGDIVQAQATLNKAQQTLPDPDQYPLKQFQDTIDYLNRFLKEGANACAAQDYRKLLYCIDRCLQTSPSSTAFKLNKAECLTFLGKYKEAEFIVIDILQMDKQNVEAIYIRGKCLYYQECLHTAFAYFQQVLRLAPDHTKALDIYKKARCLKKKKEDGNAAFKKEKYKLAYDLYSEALKIDPKNIMTNAKLHFNKATVAFKLGNLQESITECTEALKLDEKYLKALLRRAASHMKLENYEEAVNDLENACTMEGSRANKRLLQEAKQALKKSKRKDYYNILGIDKNASINDIKKAYRKRAMVHHPDRHPNATEGEKREQEKKFKEVGEAYGILSDPKKRSRYDNGYDVEEMDNSQDAMFQTFFGNGGGSFYFQGTDLGNPFSY